MSSNRLSLLDLSTSVGFSTNSQYSICDTFLGYMGSILLLVKDKLLLVLHFKTKRRIFQPLLARHLKAGFTSAQNSPRIVIPQIKTNIRKDRNINRLPIHYAPIKQGLMLGSPNPQLNNVAEESLDISTFRVLT